MMALLTVVQGRQISCSDYDRGNGMGGTYWAKVDSAGQLWVRAYFYPFGWDSGWVAGYATNAYAYYPYGYAVASADINGLTGWGTDGGTSGSCSVKWPGI